MCIEMHRLLSETQTMLAGYYWGMEYTSNMGLHIHFIGCLEGQGHKKSYRISRQLGDIWRRISEGEGYFHLCRAKDKYPVRIDHVIHYSDKSAVDTGAWNIRQTWDFIFILSAAWRGKVTRNLIGYPGNWEISGGGSRKGRVIFTCAGLKTNTRCVSIT